MKINTHYIKENVLPNKGYKRVTKRKFEYNNAVHQTLWTGEPTILDGALNWRKYTNEDQCDDYYVIDDGTNIVYHGDNPFLPMSCFEWGLEIEDEDEYMLWVSYKEGNNNLGDYEDNLRDESVAGFGHLLQESGIEAENIMECAWSLEWTGQEIPSESEVLRVLSNILKPYGMVLNKQLCEGF